MSGIPSPPSGLEHVVERFDHVSVAVPDIRAALPLVDLMQGKLRNGGVAPGGFRWAQWYLPGAGKLELVSPVDPSDETHFLVRFLSKRGPGLHHVTFKVTDIVASIEAAEAAGFHVVDISIEGPGWKEAFLHPRSASGVLLQLAEWTEREPPPDVTIEAVLGDQG